MASSRPCERGCQITPLLTMWRMGLSAYIALFPIAGPFHTRWPRYNVVHVRDSVAAFAPDVIALTPLAPGALSDPIWQDTPELPLPHTIVPWALRVGVPVVEVGLAPGDPQDPGLGGSAEDLKRYLEMYEDGAKRLRRVDVALGPITELLSGPLDLSGVISDLLPAIERHQKIQTEELGAGPGDEWREQRAALIASRSLAALRSAALHRQGNATLRLAIVAEVDRVPALHRALSGPAAAASGVDVEIVQAPPVGTGEEGRVRALLDAAMAGVGQPESLLRSLAAIEAPEARYHEANILLENGHPAEALERLEELVSGDFQEPYFLPGFALARLGQLRDLAAKREDAMRSYRGVMALTYAPQAAREAAAAGLKTPFGLEDAGS